MIPQTIVLKIVMEFGVEMLNWMNVVIVMALESLMVNATVMVMYLIVMMYAVAMQN